MANHPIRVGLLGCGSVGTALVELVGRQQGVVAGRAGVDLEIRRVAVRDVGKDRGLGLDPVVFTDDAMSVVTDPEIDVVVELIGGVDPALGLVEAALAAGKPVVSGNKELIAAQGPRLYAAADAAGVDLLFEAAVAGGIPLLRVLRESLVGEPIRRVMGIVNGTTNFILTQMTETGAAYGDALAEAQRLGYAEADPTADVEGLDAGAKAAIVATIAFGAVVVASDVACEGISSVSADDIAVATRLGYVVKLLAVAENVGIADDGDPIIAVRVHPALVPLSHPLAAVRDSFNAVFVEGDAVDDLMLYGRGAGGMPTASAVLGDLIDAGSNLARGTHGSIGRLGAAHIQPIDDLESEYYLSLDVTDEPGVLATVAGVFGSHKVSIRSMEQVGQGNAAQLFFITHTAVECNLRATLREFEALDCVRSVGSTLRVVAG